MTTTDLFCIDLDQPALEGFRKFISAWLLRGEKVTAVVDPGPLSTIPHLVEELRKRNVTHLDYILLTHIHIDHAGGAGALLKTFPDARVICHPEGIKHLIAPEKLWQGSLKVLGKMAEAYGEISPIPDDRIGPPELLTSTEIEAFLTPGHAQHHVCYLHNDLLFAGEVAGVRSEVSQGIYMRPATPPRFILEVALDSVERMIALSPRRMVFAHYGLVDDALAHLEIGRKQLSLWVRGITETSGIDPSAREEGYFNWLLAHDKVFGNLNQLPRDIAARERYFLGNTFRGMLEYVENLSTEDKKALSP